MLRSLRRTVAGLPQTVIALGVVSLLTDLSSEMIYPLLPVFLTVTLGASAVALGVVEGFAEATASLLKVGSGWMTDRSGRRKPLVVAGYAISGLARPLIGLAASWPFVTGLRMVDRLGKGLRTSPRDALIADVTDTGSIGRAFGLHRAMDHLGAVLGPLVAAGLLLIPGVDLRGVFLLAAIPAFAVIMVLWRAVSDRTVAQRPPSRKVVGLVDLLRQAGPGYGRLLIAIAVFGLGNSSDAFLLLWFADQGLSPIRIALLWSAHNLVKSVTTLAGGKWSDRVGPRRLVVLGWLVYAVVYVAFPWSRDQLPVLVVLFLVYGITFGFTEPAERAWVSTAAPDVVRGSAFGLYHGIVGLTALPASVVFGVLYATLGPAVAFSTGAALAIVAVLILMLGPITSAPQPPVPGSA